MGRGTLSKYYEIPPLGRSQVQNLGIGLGLAHQARRFVSDRVGGAVRSTFERYRAKAIMSLATVDALLHRRYRAALLCTVRARRTAPWPLPPLSSGPPETGMDIATVCGRPIAVRVSVRWVIGAISVGIVRMIIGERTVVIGVMPITPSMGGS
jgi:hypothetical protein